MILPPALGLNDKLSRCTQPYIYENLDLPPLGLISSYLFTNIIEDVGPS